MYVTILADTWLGFAVLDPNSCIGPSAANPTLKSLVAFLVYFVSLDSSTQTNLNLRLATSGFTAIETSDTASESPSGSARL